MKILAMDSSGTVAGVALVENGTVIAEYNVNYKKTHSQTLLPMLDEIAKMTELDLNTVDAFAIAAGPGSFTGLRIGSATVKGLGLALDKPVVSVPTLEGMAYNCWGYNGIICPMMDARRDQVFSGIYVCGSSVDIPCEKSVGDLNVICDQMADSVDVMIAKLNELGEKNQGLKVILLGDGVTAQFETIKEKLKISWEVAPANMNRQRAASVGTLGSIYFEEGKFEAASDHKPEYLRVSQAERERAECLK